MKTPSPWIAALAALCLSLPALAQYSAVAGQNAPMEARSETVVDDTGRSREVITYQPAVKDRYGNADGNKYDLAVDGAFDGQTVAVMQLYVEPNFDFSLPKQALAQKGFAVYRWIGAAPSPAELKKALEKANQLWIISDDERHLNAEHLKLIKQFFDSGHGVYIWGDNEPYYADANYVAEALLGTQMLGNLMGDQTVGLESQRGGQKVGLLRRHLLSTGLEYIYEGITIATLQPSERLQPLIHGSAGNLVAAYYDHGGRRAILDGGFTRLYVKWDTAGTGRYVKNAAAWLANAERFGHAVLGPAGKTTAKQ